MNNIEPKGTRLIHINSTPSKVWAIITTPAHMKVWMSEEEINVVSDWKVGGPILLIGKLIGKKYESNGHILELDPGKIFGAKFPDYLTCLKIIPLLSSA